VCREIPEFSPAGGPVMTKPAGNPLKKVILPWHGHLARGWAVFEYLHAVKPRKSSRIRELCICCSTSRKKKSKIRVASEFLEVAKICPPGSGAFEFGHSCHWLTSQAFATVVLSGSLSLRTIGGGLSKMPPGIGAKGMFGETFRLLRLLWIPARSTEC
jgi:hypothetical protein